MLAVWVSTFMKFQTIMFLNGSTYTHTLTRGQAQSNMFPHFFQNWGRKINMIISVNLTLNSDVDQYS